ncbi:MAG: TIGR03619 family F420-dependent LLM class oxidoreductase [Rhodocyclales bacterium]|nr:TIGR03619 family F420-dependent LLM class oxidoreductase [Rhodocyclales bacterium]
MRFALAAGGTDNYPPAMAPWEGKATGVDILRFARAADKMSWDWLAIPEHLVMPAGMAEHMGTRFLEGLSACAVLMGATERIHMLTYILALPYRNPLLLAKQIATVEFIAGGRFTLGTAIGHLEDEFKVLGVPFEKRGKITDEYIAALREAWTSDRPEFFGQFVSFKDVVIEPKPMQKPCPPIYIGGNSEAAMRRAVKHGDGWIPWLVTAETLPNCLEFMRKQPDWEAKADRFEVLVTTTAYNVEDNHLAKGDTVVSADRDSVLREIEGLKKAGATAVHVRPPKVATIEQSLEWIDWYDKEIIPQFR